MRLIKQSHEIWEQDTSGDLLQGIYKQIERAGRVCYKSEDKITEDSAEKFAQRLIDSKHYAMLEHGTVYLKQECSSDDEFVVSSLWKYKFNPYSILEWYIIPGSGCNKQIIVTTNFRVITENRWEKDLQYLCTPTEHHAKRVTVHFTTSRTVTHELVRHRKFSFAMESTRYCNYSKDKFGGELTFIRPNWLTEEPVLIEDPVYAEANAHFTWALEAIEHAYFDLIKANWKPQQATTILPNALKAEIVVTGFIDDWKHVFDLRVKGTTGAPHPQMLELMKPVYEEFEKKGLI